MLITAPPTSIKLLVLDIDGTLLNPEGEITAATLAAIQAARQMSVIVTLATARRYGNTAPIATELGIDCPLILCDGAMIVQYPHMELLHSCRLQADVAQQAVDLLVRHRIQPVVHPFLGLIEEIWTGPAELDNLWIEAYFTAYPEQMKRMPYKDLCAGHPDPLRVVAFASEEAIQGLISEVSELDCSWTAIKRGSYGSAEMVIMNPGCSKASGVEALATILSIPLEEVMAIGDNNNDSAMLQTVGWVVAMGHAPDAVKAAANAITASNAEDGAALAIERYVLDFLRNARQADSNSLNR
ncbi:MAG: Cof-type HAD-IIB family hydrolase [Chloroflexota bacterium]|nr:Cof-type HAD-IIB family hydrolase [Chloroflexota bacterium]